jgi:hypothetical protein
VQHQIQFSLFRSFVITFVLLFRFQTSFYLNNLIIFLSKSSDKKMIHRNIIGSYIKIGEMAILLQRNDAVSLTGSVPNQCRPDSALRLQSAKGRLRHLLPSESLQSHPSRFKAIQVASKHWQLARAFTPARPGKCVQHARRQGFPEKNARHNATCNWP